MLRDCLRERVREWKGKATDEREDEVLTADGRKNSEVSTLYVSVFICCDPVF